MIEKIYTACFKMFLSLFSINIIWLLIIINIKCDKKYYMINSLFIFMIRINWARPNFPSNNTHFFRYFISPVTHT